jgi:hypothetical protein
MKALIGPLLLSLTAFEGGCRSGPRTSPSPAHAIAPGAGLLADGEAAHNPFVPVQTDRAFSAPIAAARVGDDVVVAGLVQSAGVIRVMGFRRGRSTWRADAIRGVSWTPNAELTIQAAGDGLAVVFRSGLGTEGAGEFVLLGPQGEARGESVDVRAAVCTTSAGAAWVERRPRGAARVLARAWTETAPSSLLNLAPDRTATLACADRSVFVLADGDDDVTVAAFVPGDPVAEAPYVAIRNGDFADDERDHQAFTTGNGLEIVRVGEQGAVATRDIPALGGPSPWRKLKHSLSGDDDIVAIDGDGTSTLVVFTRDVEDACASAGSLAQRVKVLEIDRKTGAESVLDLASADCARSLGPFWIASAPSGANATLVAWTERKRQADAKAAAISGLGYRRIDGGGQGAGRIDLDTDALVEAGCDRGLCLAAALIRESGDDGGMRPMAISVFAYP